MQEDNLEWCLNALPSTISQSSDLEFGPCFSCFLSRHPNTEGEEVFQRTGVDPRARSVRNIYRFWKMHSPASSRREHEEDTVAGEMSRKYHFRNNNQLVDYGVQH